jgi:hypothetical protein
VSALPSPDGWPWTKDCLQAHLRNHLPMHGPWCADVIRAAEAG